MGRIRQKLELLESQNKQSWTKGNNEIIAQKNKINFVDSNYGIHQNLQIRPNRCQTTIQTPRSSVPNLL